MLRPSDMPQKDRVEVIDHTGISYLETVNLHCPSDWIWNPLGDISPGRLGGSFQKQLPQERRAGLECGQVSLHGLGSRVE